MGGKGPRPPEGLALAFALAPTAPAKQLELQLRRRQRAAVAAWLRQCAGPHFETTTGRLEARVGFPPHPIQMVDRANNLGCGAWCHGDTRLGGSTHLACPSHVPLRGCRHARLKWCVACFG